MINSIIDNLQIENAKEFKKELCCTMNAIYNENLKNRFCDLIGLDYNTHYQMLSEDIDYLFEKFNVLSRKFIPNYLSTNIAEGSDNITFLFDFSMFFQKYLIKKDTENYNIFLGIQLLINNTEKIIYDKIGFIKEKIDEYFEDELVKNRDKDLYLIEAMKFIERYDKLFENIRNEINIEKVKLKQYIINSERNYITGNSYIYGELSDIYENNKIDNRTLNKIINVLINSNKKNNYENRKEISIGLQLYENYLYYWNVSEEYYYLVLEPFSNLKIDFAKLVLNDKEIMLSHSKNGNGKIMISDKIYFENLEDFLSSDVVIKINGK